MYGTIKVHVQIKVWSFSKLLPLSTKWNLQLKPVFMESNKKISKYLTKEQ